MVKCLSEKSIKDDDSPNNERGVFTLSVVKIKPIVISFQTYNITDAFVGHSNIYVSKFLEQCNQKSHIINKSRAHSKKDQSI